MLNKGTYSIRLVRILATESDPRPINAPFQYEVFLESAGKNQGSSEPSLIPPLIYALQKPPLKRVKTELDPARVTGWI